MTPMYLMVLWAETLLCSKNNSFYRMLLLCQNIRFVASSVKLCTWHCVDVLLFQYIIPDTINFASWAIKVTELVQYLLIAILMKFWSITPQSCFNFTLQLKLINDMRMIEYLYIKWKHFKFYSALFITCIINSAIFKI